MSQTDDTPKKGIFAEIARRALATPPSILDGEPLRKSEGVSLEIPDYMVEALKRGLRLHEEGKSGDGLKPATVAAARQGIKDGRWSEDKWLKAAAWLARHRSSWKSGEDNKPGSESPGFVAWLLWGDGGDERGRKFIERKAEAIKAARGGMSKSFKDLVDSSASYMGPNPGGATNLGGEVRTEEPSSAPPQPYAPYDNNNNTQPPEHRHFFMDTEFMEDGKDGEGYIDLISIGIADKAGRTFYAVNQDADFSGANEWVRENVLPLLPPPTDPAWMPPKEIARRVLEFLMPDELEPHVWTWYGAYDHVVFCWLFGPMSELPEGLAKFARDLKFMLPFFEGACGQKIKEPPEPEAEHNALADALWLRDYWFNVEEVCSGIEWFDRL